MLITQHMPYVQNPKGICRLNRIEAYGKKRYCEKSSKIEYPSAGLVSAAKMNFLKAKGFGRDFQSVQTAF